MREPKRFLVRPHQGSEIVTADIYATKYWSADFYLARKFTRTFHRDLVREISELAPGEEAELPAEDGFGGGLQDLVAVPGIEERVAALEEHVYDLQNRLRQIESVQ